MQRPLILTAVALCLAATFGACTRTPPCPVCYEDEWSRTPFPGQETQHTRTLTPEEVDAMVPRPATDTPFLDATQPCPSAAPAAW